MSSSSPKGVATTAIRKSRSILSGPKGTPQETICQVVDYGGTTGGSFISAMQSLARAVVRRGDRFVVVARDIPGSSWGGDLREAGAEVYFVRTGAEAVRVLQRIRPSIVHSHHNGFDLATLKTPANARIIWHARSHRQDVSLLARAKAVLKYRVFGRRVEKLITVSESLARECIAFSAPAHWVRAVKNGIDTERSRPPTPAERKAARDAFGIGAADRVVLFFERHPYKGGATLKLALEKLEDVRLLVVGGTKADRALFGGPPRVISLDRVLEAREAYWAADVLAFASENEAFGFVLAEALACGLPVAATDIPVVREICGRTFQAVLFPVRDGNAMAAALREAIGRSGLSGRDRIVERFSLERWTADILELYYSPGLETHGNRRPRAPLRRRPRGGARARTSKRP